MQLKARVNARAKEAGISAQMMMQNYLSERLLERLSRSPWRDRVVVKGGMLISSLVCRGDGSLDTRTARVVGTFLLTQPAVHTGKVVGMQGSRPICEFAYGGTRQRVAITVSNNGCIVGANPRSLPQSHIRAYPQTP